MIPVSPLDDIRFPCIPPSGVDNIVADNISRLSSTTVDKDDTSASKALSITNKLFATRLGKKSDCGYPTELALVQQDQQKDLRNINRKLNTYMRDQRYCYSQKEPENVEIILFDNNIYV